MKQRNDLAGANSSERSEQEGAAVAIYDLTFPQIGEFRAMWLAEEWIEQNGYTVGSCQGGAPRGIMPAGYAVMKWRNLSQQDRAALYGQMTGDMRNGPVRVAIIRALPTPESTPGADSRERDGQMKKEGCDG